jgi:hypothetical protein
MALQSQLFRGDPKLEKAAVSDPAHILPGERGPHVVKIQQALIQVAGATILPDGNYGPATAAAVADFKRKHQPQILNFGGRIDDIVGIKTLAALDSKLPKPGGLNLNFILGITLVDIVVNFIGAAGASPRDPEEAILQSLLFASHVPVQDPFSRKLLRHKTNGNLLFRIAQGTTEFGLKGAPVLARVLLSIATMLRGRAPLNDNPLLPGNIFILGTSSGGRNAINFAGLLVQSGFSPHLVASIDASFFQSETDTRPSDNPQRVLPTPNFQLSRIAEPVPALIPRVPNRHNFFQTKGNHRGDSFNPFASPFFTSDMAGGLEEIHGRVDGFTNHEVAVRGAFGKTDDGFHEECDALGRREVQLMIAGELRGI